MATRPRHQKAALDVSPPDNLPLRTQIIEQYVPQLSLADMVAVNEAMRPRAEALQAAQQHATLEAHYAHLRALPAGTLLQIAVTHSGLRAAGFAEGDRVTLERSLRPPSTKLVVQDGHGKTWRFFMDWLISATEDESVRIALHREFDRKLWGALLPSSGAV